MTPYAPTWVTPSVGGQLSNRLGSAAPVFNDGFDSSTVGAAPDPTPTYLFSDGFELAGSNVNYFSGMGTSGKDPAAANNSFVNLRGTWTKASNIVTAPVTAGKNQLAMGSAGPQIGGLDMSLYVYTQRWATAQIGAGIIFFSQSLDNSYVVKFNGVNTLGLYKNVSGTLTQLGSNLSFTWAAGSPFWLKADCTVAGTITWGAATDTAGAPNAYTTTGQSDSTYTKGGFGLYNDGTGTAPTAGGAFSNVCQVQGDGKGWTPAIDSGSNTFDSLYYISKTAYAGIFSGVIFTPVGGNAGSAGQTTSWQRATTTLGAIAYSVTAAAKAPSVASAWNLSLGSINLSVNGQSQWDTTESLSGTPGASANLNLKMLTTGTVYFDQVAVYTPTSLTNINRGVLTRSLGTDSSSSLTWWIIQSGAWSLTSNVLVATSGAPARIQKGAADLSDYTVWARTQWENGGTNNNRVLLRAQGATYSGYEMGWASATTVDIWRVDAGVYTSLVAAVTLTTVPVQGQWVWFKCTAAAGVFTLTVYTDFQGQVGATMGPVCTSSSDTTYATGPCQLVDFSAPYVSWGGPFSNVFLIGRGRPTSLWGMQPSGNVWTTYEPDFNWSSQAPLGGLCSASIQNIATAAGVSSLISLQNAGQTEINAIVALPNATYTISFWMKTLGVIGIGAYCAPREFTSGGALVKDWAATAMTPVTGSTGWTNYSFTITTSATTAFMSLRFNLANNSFVSQIWVDNVKVTSASVDAIDFQVLYSNVLGSSDPLGGFRVSASRLKANATISDAAWDTWNTSLVGSLPNQQPLPSFNVSTTTGPTNGTLTQYYNGRVYVATPDSTLTITLIYSAPVTANNVGTWRLENAPTAPASVTGLPIGGQGTVYSLVIANGNIFISTALTQFHAPILSDGTIGAWTIFENLVPGSSLVTGLYSYTDNTGSYLIANAFTGLGAALGLWFTSIGDGGVVNAWTVMANQPNAATPITNAGFLVIPTGANDGSATIYRFGGQCNSIMVATAEKASLKAGQTSAAWTNLATGIPAALANFGLCISPVDASGRFYIYIVGGNTATGVDRNGAGQASNCYYIRSDALGGAWSTLGSGTPEAVDSVGSICIAALNNLHGGVLTFGGWKGASVNLNVSMMPTTAGVPAIGAYGTSGNALTWIADGNGNPAGTIQNMNAVGATDGSQLIDFFWGAVGVNAPAISLLNGDTVTISITLVDSMGDPSPTSSIVFKIAQPPVIANVIPSNNASVGSSAPPVQFNHLGQAGLAIQSKYRIQVQSVGGATTYYDSGTLPGQANNAIPQIYPALPNGTYQLVIDTYTDDVAFPGSTNHAQSITQFIVAANAAGVGSAVTAVPDPVLGGITIGWTNTGAQTNRIYTRQNGTTAWTLIKNNYAGSNGANSIELMDSVSVGIPMDYQVTAVSSQGNESTIGAVLNVTITPDSHWDKGGWDVMLHVVGSGASLNAPMFTKKPIKMRRIKDVEIKLMFGNRAPSYRYGKGDYWEIEFAYESLNAAQLAQFYAVASVVQTGSQICYRDTMGRVIFVGLNKEFDEDSDLYVSDKIKLTEQQYTFVP